MHSSSVYKLNAYHYEMKQMSNRPIALV